MIFGLARKKTFESYLPNKGTIVNAILGKYNLISLAFGCREVPNMLMYEIKKAEQ